MGAAAYNALEPGQAKWGNNPRGGLQQRAARSERVAAYVAVAATVSAGSCR